VELLGDIAVILLVARPSPHPLCSDIFQCAPAHGSLVRPVAPRHAPRALGSGIIVFVCVVGEVAYAHARTPLAPTDGGLILPALDQALALELGLHLRKDPCSRWSIE
jgi:hypothetical protein